MINVLRVVLRRGIITGLLLPACASLALGQGAAGRPKAKPGELLVNFAHGTPRAAVDASVSKFGGTVAKEFGPIDVNLTKDCYLVTIPGADDTTTDAKLIAAKADPNVVGVFRNQIRYVHQAGTKPTVTPNDPHFVPDQWNMTQINMPTAWPIEKGQKNVVVAVIDTGFDTTHPDFDPRRVFAPFNVITGTTDPQHDTGEEHGTLVAGYVNAWTNNSEGVSGICWNNVLLMPIKTGTEKAGFSLANLVAAVQYVQKQKSLNPSLSFVVNMSLGGDAPSDIPNPSNLSPDEDAILQAAKAGIVFTISAGNSGGGANPASTPAFLCQLSDNILSVAATSEKKTRASYSTFRPYTTIAAPGGDSSQGRGIFGTVPVALGTYKLISAATTSSEGGTSSAAPHVAGVAALLLSVPGVKPTDIKSVITSTAQPVSGFKVPSAEFGYGILDATAALEKVAVGVSVLNPDGFGGKGINATAAGVPSETLSPAIRVHVSQIPSTNFTLSVDRVTVPISTSVSSGPSFAIENVTASKSDSLGNTTPVTFDAVVSGLNLAPGQHQVIVTGTKTDVTPNIVVTDNRTFFVTPHQVPAGRSLVSIPYYLKIGSGSTNEITPETYFGTDFRLARWSAAENGYKYYTSFGLRDPQSSFTPGDIFPHQDGLAAEKFPLGLAFWSDIESNKPILTAGQPVVDAPFIIPLRGTGAGSGRSIAWNMVGDPFPFDVPFNALLVDTPSGRISLQDAVNRGYVLPNLFSYSAAEGYTFRTLPDGAIRAWQGHWIGVTSAADLALVVPPVPVTRAANISKTNIVGNGGWQVQFGVSSRGMRDSNILVGVSSRAADSYDRLDVPKPPLVSPYVSLGVQHSDWNNRNGLYATDYRSATGSKVWTLVADSDQKNTDVSVTWNLQGVPRNTRMMLKDETTGQIYEMRSRSAITFNTGDNATPRKFTVTASSSAQGSLAIRNFGVRASRASGSSQIGFTLSADASYEVKVLAASGNSVANIATRAAGAGDVLVVWNGKDLAGRSVASGTYLVQVKATTPDGETVKAIYPFSVVR